MAELDLRELHGTEFPVPDGQKAQQMTPRTCLVSQVEPRFQTNGTR